MANKIVLVGKAASGKDHLRKRLMDKGLSYGVSHTTRPPREGELDGKDYHFVTEEEFLNIVNDGNMVEYQQFVGWYYGMTRAEWDKADIIILNVEALEQLTEEVRNACTVIYLDIPIEVREQRMLERNDTDDSHLRRLAADEEQFRGFKNYDIKITNPDF